MTFTLMVTDHGRWHYMERMLASLDEVIGLDFFDRKVAGFDGCRPPESIGRVFDVWVASTAREGLTANLSQTWAELDLTDEWVVHVESDFVIHDAPLAEMAATLDANRNVANMVLARQPVNPQEIAAGSVLATVPGLVDRGGWCEHAAGFWLNPFVARASLLRTLHAGVETDLTAQCLARGMTFGYWGSPADPPRCEHIGVEGGMWSEGWKL